nr:Glu-tRNA(Gln) amidotransferase subunit GatE [Methanopyrus sp. SNP6]
MTPLPEPVREEDLDWEEIGLRVGLEIHRQLDTSRKLFCRCTPELGEEVPEEPKVRRKLRPVQSEMGEFDPAALEEFKRDRTFYYLADGSFSCLVELDEEPPHEPCSEALDVAIKVTLLLGGSVVDEVHVMRKMVIDGSNTTGFQRTMLVGFGGEVPTSEGPVRISTVCLEEDAARKVKGRDQDLEVDYCLDRLGIPLIEVSTEPDIRTPEQAREAAERIGEAIKAVGGVKSGIGTVRQDVNVSIKGGAVQEIKGVQDLNLIPKVVKYEALRQANLLRIRDELRERDVSETDLVNCEPVDVTDVFEDTDSEVIRRELERDGVVYALLLPGFEGILGWELCPGRRFGTELADYARRRGVSGLFHSDELPKYGISEEEVETVRQRLGVEDGDGFVLIAGPEDRVKSAMEAVKDRAIMALKGVPAETRRARKDGTTEYMRPRPGAARMYPETDIPPVVIDEDRVKELAEKLPEKPWERKERLTEEYGLGEELVEQMFEHGVVDEFEKIVEETGAEPKVAAATLVNTIPRLEKDGYPVDNLTIDHVKDVLKLYAEGTIAKSGIEELLGALAADPDSDPEELAEELGIVMVSEEEIEEVVEEAIRRYKDEIRERGMAVMGKIMGEVMEVLRGRADGKRVSELVRERIQEISGE